MSSNAWGSLRERGEGGGGGSDGHLFWIMLLVGVGLNPPGPKYVSQGAGLSFR